MCKFEFYRDEMQLKTTKNADMTVLGQQRPDTMKAEADF